MASCLGMRNLFGLVAVLIAVSGCGAHRHAGTAAPPEAAAREADDMDAVMKKVAEARGGYRLAPDDLISVTVYQDKDMGVKAHVDSDGSISMPLVGAVPVAGATVAEAQKRIEEKLTRYFVHPTVSLVVESYGAKQLFVLGEVQKPGPYPMPANGHVSVLQAITDAGGFTKAAAPRRTHVLRYADGKSRDYKIDLKSLIKRGDRGEDILLEANDVIYVPQTLF